MINKILSYFYPAEAQKPPLERTLDFLSKRKIVNVNTMDPIKDQHFFVGREHNIRFLRDNTGCILGVNGETVPLLVFITREETTILRQYIIGRCSVAASEGGAGCSKKKDMTS